MAETKIVIGTVFTVQGIAGVILALLAALAYCRRPGCEYCIKHHLTAVVICFLFLVAMNLLSTWSYELPLWRLWIQATVYTMVDYATLQIYLYERSNKRRPPAT